MRVVIGWVSNIHCRTGCEKGGMVHVHVGDGIVYRLENAAEIEIASYDVPRPQSTASAQYSRNTSP